jgi:hypothetical protein
MFIKEVVGVMGVLEAVVKEAVVKEEMAVHKSVVAQEMVALNVAVKVAEDEMVDNNIKMIL